MFVNENIKNTERVFPMQGRYGYLRYDMNENPEGLPEEFVKSVLKEITPEFLAIYPEPDRFLHKYAHSLNVGYDNVMATNGSDMAIRYLLETFGEPGKDVVTVSPSFEMYWVNCNILGYHHVPVSYEPDLTIRIEKITDAINAIKYFGQYVHPVNLSSRANNTISMIPADIENSVNFDLYGISIGINADFTYDGKIKISNSGAQTVCYYIPLNH